MKIQKCGVTGAWLVLGTTGKPLPTGPLATRDAARAWVRMAKAQTVLTTSIVDEIIAEEKQATAAPVEQPNHEAPAVEPPAPQGWGSVDGGVVVEFPTAAEFRETPARTTRISHAPAPRPLVGRTALGLALRVAGVDDLLPSGVRGELVHASV